MDPNEIEYLAQKTLITVIPTFNSNIIHLISGDFGPFSASLPVQVPLWLAVNLRQQQKCRIQAPDWMDMDKLEEIKEIEKASRTFTRMPSEHYMEEAKILLNCAIDDIPRAREIRTIIKDIWDIRMSKLRTSVDILMKGSATYASIDHLTPMEMNSIKPILPHSLDQIYRMKQLRPDNRSQNTTLISSHQMTSHSQHSTPK